MKSINYINKSFLILVLSLFSLALNAQKVKFETINISSSSLKIEDGNLVFKDKSTVLVLETRLKLLQGAATEVPFVTIELRGKIKGKEQTFSTDLVSINKLGTIEQKLTINASNDNPIYISEVTITILDNKKEIASATEPIFSIDNKKTNFAILLNGIKSNDFCEEQKLNDVFMNEFKSSKYYAVVIGLNNTKKEPSDIEKAVSNGRGKISGIYVWTESHDKRTTRIVEPFTDKNGNWFFKDSFINEKDAVKLLSFSIEYITACNDSFKYVSVFKQQLNDKKLWDYKVKMSNAASDNPIFQGTNEGGSNILALTIPASSINISGGNLEIRDNSKITFGVVGMNITNSKHKDVKAKIKIEVIPTSKRESSSIIELTTTYNTEKQLFEASANFNGSEKTPIEISKITLILITEKKDTIVYEYEGKYGYSLDGKTLYTILKKTEKNKYVDPCKTKYKLKEITYSENSYNGLSTYQFSFNFEDNSDVPADVAMIVEIKDCNGSSEYLKISLKYDEKSKTYTGSQVLAKNKDCKLEFVYGEIAAYNACKDITVWSITTSQSKKDGDKPRVIRQDMMIPVLFRI
jgi:hypothetical protein